MPACKNMTNAAFFLNVHSKPNNYGYLLVWCVWKDGWCVVKQRDGFINFINPDVLLLLSYKIVQPCDLPGRP